MKNSKVTYLIVGLLCLFATVNSQCVTLYANSNQRGRSYKTCSSGNVPNSWNDRVSSFVVASGYTVQLYADSDYEGKAYGPYNAGSYNVPAELNDQLSSLRVFAAKKCPTFYADYNQQGGSFQQCISEDVPANWNDQVSSFVVPAGYTVQLYADGAYGGKMYGAYSAGSYNVPAEFNDQLSSIRIFAAQKCPTFYADYNQQGSSFQQCISGNVPANWNDQASSFVVPAGYTIQLYADGAYGGKMYGAYNAGSYNVPAEFNDQLSSIKVYAVQKCPTFYADYNQQGGSFQQCSSGNVPDTWNDQVSSFVVPAGYSIQLYADSVYGGKLYGPYAAGSHNVPAEFNDKLSSIKIFIV